MTITFRDAIGIYPGKGSKLTKGEVDANFYDLLLRVIELETGGAFGLDSIEFTGTTITFHWSDETSSGPFLLPVATFRAAGPWTNSTPLLYLDVVTITGVGTFLVMLPHTTPDLPEEFDPAAENDSGEQLYLQISESADLEGLVRFRGDYAASESYFVGDMFLTSTHGLIYVVKGHTSGVTFDLFAESGGDRVYEQIAPPPAARVEETDDSTYTVTAADAGAYLRFTSGCTVFLDVDLDIALGTEIHFRQVGEGPVTFGLVIGVTINPQRDGYDTATPWVGATVTAKYVASNEWDLIGPHGAASSE